MRLGDVSQALDSAGFVLLGGFRPDERDDVPKLVTGETVAAVLMVGNAGAAMWQRFSGERPSGPDPLDNWTKSMLTPIADRFGSSVVFPFQRPYFPFQRWLRRTGGSHPSPLGLSIHPTYGLWHGLRGALLFAKDIMGLGDASLSASPCDLCLDRPCLHSCPVSAFTGSSYDVPKCISQLEHAAGEDCMTLGCRARRACPIGRDYRYAPAQANFHMEAFRATCRTSGEA